MEQARSSIKEFAFVCAGTYLVVLLAAFLSVPYALGATPGEPSPTAQSVPHLS